MIYSFNSFSINTGEYLFSDGTENKALEPLVFDALVYLIENRDRIVPKDELIDKLWGGRIITDSALNTCIRSIRRALGDNREKQKFIRTFPKRGFQFVAEVDILEVSIDLDSQQSTETTSIHKTERNYLWRKIALVATVLIAAIVYGRANWHEQKSDRSLSPKPVIAVLDFNTDLHDETQIHFAEGLSEELVSSLSLYRELFVIARGSSALYSPSETNIREFGRELGAQYIVSGNARYEGSQISVSARLVDINSGQHIWSDDFDSDQQGLFKLQRDLAYLIAGQIVPELARSDFEKNIKKAPEVMGAWALYHQARVRQSVYTKEDQEESIRLAELALVKDPNLAAAYGVIARAKGVQFFYQWSQLPSVTLEQAISSAKKAINLDKNDPTAYAALGYIYRYTGDETSAIANLERATFLNPSDANIKLEYAHTLDWFRHQDKALPVINEAIRLSPKDPRLENMYFYKSHIQYHLKKYEESLETSRKMSGVLTTDTWRVFYHLIRAANFAQLNKNQEAKNNIIAALSINSKLSLTAMKKRFEGSKNHPENRRFWLAGLKKAGLPM